MSAASVVKLIPFLARGNISARTFAKMSELPGSEVSKIVAALRKGGAKKASNVARSVVGQREYAEAAERLSLTQDFRRARDVMESSELVHGFRVARTELADRQSRTAADLQRAFRNSRARREVLEDQPRIESVWEGTRASQREQWKQAVADAEADVAKITERDQSRPARMRKAQDLRAKQRSRRIWGGVGGAATGIWATDVLAGWLRDPEEETGVVDSVLGLTEKRQIADAYAQRQTFLDQKMRVERLQRDMAANQARLAQMRPDLYNQMLYGRMLPRGAVPIGGTPDDAFLKQVALAMSSGAFQAEPSAEQQFLMR